MSAQRNALGRGLGALIPGAGKDGKRRVGEPPATKQTTTDGVTSHGVAQIKVDHIDPNPEQPRRTFAPDRLASMAASISRHGVLQPVVVRRAGERYELIVGERRWRATRAAGLATIPAVIADVDPADRLELAIIENVQRHDLNPIELAHAYQALSDAGATQEEVGERVSMSRSSVANHMRLLELSRDIQEDVETDRLTMGHAKALLQVTNPERRLHLRDRVLRDGLSVREAERLGRELAGPAPARKPRKARTPSDPTLAPLVDLLRDHLQARVRIHGPRDGGGRIEIEYAGAEDLDRLCSLIVDGA